MKEACIKSYATLLAVKLDKPVEGNAKGETHTMNPPFGKKTDFDFKVSLVEETIPSNNNVWNPWIGIGNPGDAVSQAYDIEKIETTWNLRREMKERAQLNKNGIQNDTHWLREFRSKSSRTGTQLCSLKVPTAASWSNGSCNGPATPFKTMWTQHESFGELEVSVDRLKLVRNPQMIKGWGAVVRKTQRRSTNRSENESQ